MTIRQAIPSDAAACCAIYNPFVEHSVVSFEYDPVSVEAMAERIAHKHNWLILELKGLCVGFAYYGSFRERIAYQHVVETSIYLAPSALGQGMGAKLYGVLLEDAAQRGYTEAVASIAVPNPQSTNFHERMGFIRVGHLPRSGYKFGRYIDMEFWQKSLI